MGNDYQMCLGSRENNLLPTFHVQLSVWSFTCAARRSALVWYGFSTHSRRTWHKCTTFVCENYAENDEMLSDIVNMISGTNFTCFVITSGSFFYFLLTRLQFSSKLHNSHNLWLQFMATTTCISARRSYLHPLLFYSYTLKKKIKVASHNPCYFFFVCFLLSPEIPSTGFETVGYACCSRSSSTHTNIV